MQQVCLQFHIILAEDKIRNCEHLSLTEIVALVNVVALVVRHLVLIEI